MPLSASFLERNASKLFWGLFVLQVLSWTIIPALVQPNAPLDVIEGFAWGREWPLGTYKHPPLAAWMQEAIYHLLGTCPLGYNFLNALCTGIALWAVYRTGWLLAGKAQGLLAAALAQSILYFNLLSAQFNPNVLQLMFWALGGYAFTHALIREKLKYWLLLGVVFALGLYGKYEMGLLGLIFAAFLLLHPQGRKSFATPGPYVALFTTVVLFLPQLLWLIQNDFLPFSYAVNRAKVSKNAVDQVFYPLRFLGAQLADFLPALIGSALLLLPLNKTQARPSLKKDLLFWLAFIPLAFLVTLALVAGRHLKDMWGMPFLSFIPLWLITHFSLRWDRLRIFAIYWGGIFVLTLALFVGNLTFAIPWGFKPPRGHFPGQELSTLIHQEWHKKTPSPLVYVVGDTWLAGNVAFYSREKTGRPHVWIDADTAISPWIDPQKVKKTGAVLIWNGSQPPEWLSHFPKARRQKAFELQWKPGGKAKPVEIGWALLPAAPASR
ncbi:MAG: glycosyltransferase family 39 protein [Proteobacteria bacterium]|nr:glycosyltransferase family 39 protein [Pseudomonadota bacterium]